MTASASIGRRSASGSSSVSTRCSGRLSRSATMRGPAPAPSSRRTSLRGSSRSAFRRGSASRARNPRPTGPPRDRCVNLPLGELLVIVTILLALFTIVFAELVPKTLALANAERVAITLSLPIEFLARALSPLIALLTGITATIARVFGANVSNEAQITAEELRLIVERGGEQGVLEAEEEQMINAVIELGSRRVHEVMVPRIAMATIQATATFDEAIETIVEHGHSRIPDYDESVDEILGILYAKDLLPFLRESAGPRPDLRTLLRTPVYIPESMTVDDLLHEFQRRKVHIAIVLDEY